MSDRVDLGAILDGDDDALNALDAGGDSGADDITLDDAFGSEPEAATEAVTDDGRPRDDKGRFAEKDKAAAVAAAQPKDKQAGDTAAAAQTAPTTTAEQPKGTPTYQPYAIKLGDADQPIPGVHVATDGTHTYLAMTQDARQQFEQIVTQAHQIRQTQQQWERQYRERVQAFEEQAKAPKPPTENEIAGRTVIEMMNADPELVDLIQQHRPHFFKEWHLNARQSIMDVGAERQKAETEKVTSAEQERTELGTIADETEALYERFKAELPNVTRDDLKDIFNTELRPIRAVLMKMDTGQEFVLNKLRARSKLNTAEAERVRLAKQREEDAKAAAFNASQQPAKPAQPIKAPKRETVAAGNGTPSKSGRQKFDDYFRTWNKRPGLDDPDEDE